MAEMTEMTYDNLDLLFCGSTDTFLREFYVHLGLDETRLEGLNKRKLLKEIRDFVDNSLDNNTEEDNHKNLLDWLRFLGQGEDPVDDETPETHDNPRNGNMEQNEEPRNGTPEPEPRAQHTEFAATGEPRPVDSFYEMKRHYERLLENQQQEFAALVRNLPGTSKDSVQNSGARVGHSQGKAHDQHNFSFIFRRELKIQGQIGEQGRGDQVSFVSLSRQIESGLEKGYSEKEITEAIIKSMKPGLQLRSYIETLRDLTLPRLRQILRSHYKEKSGTQLYQELATICQGQKETPETFLLRALDLRQKILFACQEADTNLKYDFKLVQGMFLRSIETGLRYDNILTKLRPILQDTKISDEELIHQVSSISSAETERQARLGKKSRDLQANAVLSSEGQNRQLISQKNPSETKDSHILAAVKAMQAQIKNIQEQLASQNSNTQPTSRASREGDSNPRDTKPRESFACTSCKEKGTATECFHCNYCQGDNHFARDCRKRQADQRQKQGNERGLSRRDRV
eukprot:gene11481-12678_t